MPFPKGFLWGAATASHQVEGNNHNDWSEWEQANAERLARESEQHFHWNPNWKKFRSEATNPTNYLSGNACDHWHRYAEDYDIAKGLGLDAYRFSIEWSRIEPEPGYFDEAALRQYATMLTALRARGIEPFVTLWHWTLPLWLAEKGGILASDFPKYFETYTEKVITALGEDVRFWITLNEPEVVSSHAYLKGSWPPQKKSFFLTFHAWHALKLAHRKAYACIKRYFPTAQVGIAKHQVFFDAARSTIINQLLKSLADWLWNRHFLNLIRDSQDFIGLNHYNHNRIDWGYNRNANLVQTDFGWEYYPQSLYHALVELKPYGKPIYVTENGIADASDELRKKFIPAALSAMEQAINEGVNVRGYFHWSLLDNFEWDKGYWLRFGLVHVDHVTQARTIRDSAHIYSDLVKKYRIAAE